VEFFPLTLGTPRPRPAPGAREEKESARSYEAWREGLSASAEEFDERPAAQVLAELMAATPRAAGTGGGMMFVLGEPGAGKSSLLAHWHARWFAALPPPRLGLPVPVLVPLRKVEVGALLGRPEEVADRLCQARSALARDQATACAYHDLPPRLFSPVVWLLDGLDELQAPNLAAPEVWEALAALPGVVVLSCRTAVFGQVRHDAEGAARRIIGGAREQRILGLKPAQQEGFLRLALAAEGLDPARAPELVRRLNASAPLRPLAANPLLLHLAAANPADAEMPANRAAFYAAATHKLWRRALIGEPERLALAAERDRALAALAAAMGVEKIEVRGAQALLDRVGVAAPLRRDLVRSGLLRLDEARDRLAFPHLTFQEFHLARSLRARPFAKVLAERWADARYEEVLALLMALHAEDGQGDEVGAALRALVERARESHAADPRPLWSLGRSPMRVALRLHGRATVPEVALPVQLSAEPVLLRLAIAADGQTSPAALSALSCDPDELVRARVAGNAATPAEALVALTCDFYAWVRANAASNRAMPAGALSVLTRDADAEVRSRAVVTSATSPEVLSALARNPDARSRAKAAENRATPVETLAALSRDPDARVRAWVAGNKATPAETLGVLSRDPDEWVRARVAGNAATPPRTLAALARDSDDGVRARVAENSAAPAEALAALSRDDIAEVRAWAAGNRSTPAEALAALSRDPDAGVQRGAAIADATPLSPRGLARDPDDSVRARAAENRAMPAGALAALARDPEVWVRRGAAANGATPAEALSALACDHDAGVRREAAGNGSTPAEALSALARDLDAGVRAWAAGNKATPAEALSILSRDPDAGARFGAAANAVTLLEDLAHD
jgi:Leucine rich repeat variant